MARGTRGELVFRVTGGSFDGAAAKRMCGRLEELPPGADVVIDLSRVRDVQDHGLATVASAIAARTPGVEVRGLGRHQERLLRYFGVDLARAAREAGAPHR